MAGPMTVADDADLIARLVDRGCDLTRTRQVGVHFDTRSHEVAEAVSGDLRANGWEPEVSQLRNEWLVSADRGWMVVTAESIAELRRTSEELANRHGATFHGWQASLDPGMSISRP
jgi:hypothetical protein